jgi:hypothetical protein
MATENNSNNEMTLLMSSINQSILSQAGLACWVGVYEQPVILKGTPLLATSIKDGKSWIHITFGSRLGMRTETIEHRANLIKWAYKNDEIFSTRRDCLGLIGPGAVRFLKTEGDFSSLLLPEQNLASVPRHRRSTVYA